MIYNYLFYRLNLVFKKQKYRKNPTSKASGVIGGLLLLNIYTILSILKKYFVDYTISPLTFTIIVVLTIVLSNFVFNKKRFDKAIKQYSGYSRRQLIARRVIANLYITLSIILFFIFMDNLTK